MKRCTRYAIYKYRAVPGGVEVELVREDAFGSSTPLSGDLKGWNAFYLYKYERKLFNGTVVFSWETTEGVEVTVGEYNA